MAVRHRATALVRVHWRRVLLPVGSVLNVWGNTLYDTSPDVSHRAASWTLFVGGLLLAMYGCRFWQGVADKLRTPKRVRHWAAQKWNEPTWRYRWERLKLTVWGVGVAGTVWYAVRLINGIAQQPDRVDEHFSSAMTFMYAWVFLPLWTQSAEPKGRSKGQMLEGISARVGRAAVSRTVANAAGIYFAGASVYALVFTSRPSLLVPAAVTLGAAMIATGHKTWTRLRRLSTQLYANIQRLERDLALIHTNKDKILERQDAARRSWDAVQRDLRTSVDTGYAVFSTPYLPCETTHDLGVRVGNAIEALAGDADAAKDVLDDLAGIREACSGRIDSVA
ncbi:hypothetical protein [Streptomyces sp. NPDC056817]|uniref:hypothetical protein n=1 Tax=Streptomyces sp. NPDC056817 TaxID=3345950 RepID=UPI0036936ABD